MPVDHALLSVFKTLNLVQEAVTAVKLALNNNPSPGNTLELNDHLSDLQALKDELLALRDELRNGQSTMPPPDQSLMDHVGALTAQVEQATNAGAAASTVIALAGQALDTGFAVMSLAK